MAARRSTSVSELLADQIELLVGQEETYERAEHQARRLLDQGFHFGNPTLTGRDKLHERQNLRRDGHRTAGILVENPL